ncbi:MAG TPA: MotA/TolQ/ExbB proton channel family protein [Phycisphaerales bacterium]|nr:MotA/TolQ/ExbB proton channel family protein [Phycisphaerales bacterium]HMP38145.1 MotA/TolQ/ExbB proton channel family protein [Phycisphaerales bacterium]
MIAQTTSIAAAAPLTLPSAEAAGEWGRGVVAQAMEIWNGGGWAMYPIALVALVLFGTAVHLFMTLRERGFRSVPERRWRRWIRRPEERRGPIGELMDFVDTEGHRGDDVELFRQLRVAELVPFERELRVMRTCVAAAPLLGLLGTVTGMLATFGALAGGHGGEKTMTLIAAGISEALITTQTGLVVALIGLFMQYQLARTVERYRAFLAQLETAWIQSFYAPGDGATGGSDGRGPSGTREPDASRDARPRELSVTDARSSPGRPHPAIAGGTGS